MFNFNGIRISFAPNNIVGRMLIHAGRRQGEREIKDGDFEREVGSDMK